MTLGKLIVPQKQIKSYLIRYVNKKVQPFKSLREARRDGLLALRQGTFHSLINTNGVKLPL